MIAAGLPFWLLLISVAEFALVINWLLEGNLKTKWNSFLKQPAALGLTAIFLLHIVGLLWTNHDFGYALKDLRIKLPLLLLPIVLSTSEKLTKKELFQVLGVFITSVFFASIISVLTYYGIVGDVAHDAREMSMFISHIRFSLLVSLAIFALFYIVFFYECRSGVKTVMLVVLTWLIIFLFILKAMSGIVAFFVTLLVMLGYFSVRITNRTIRSLVLSALVIIPFFVGLYLVQMTIDFFQVKEEIRYDELPKTTAAGEEYFHLYGNQQTENGYYVNYHIAEQEMRNAWSSRSSISLEGTDGKGQPLFETLKRFLTSKGLKKDQEGVEALSEREVKAVESGVANVKYLTSNSLEVRLHKIMWEFDNYSKGMNPQGNSVAQRMEFWKAGWNIYQNNPIIGVGTGDVPYEFDQVYDQINTPLSTEYRLRGHNQYLTMALTFGSIGFLIFIACLLLPFFTVENAQRYFYLAFFSIAAASMINEDTLETQIGVTFFAFFASLFLFSYKCDNLNQPTTVR